MFGIKHYEVERKIVEVLHGRSMTGVYDEAHEISAFAVLVQSYMAEVTQKVIENGAKIEQNFKTLDKINKAQA